jgi:hypothetical protein
MLQCSELLQYGRFADSCPPAMATSRCRPGTRRPAKSSIDLKAATISRQRFPD